MSASARASSSAFADGHDRRDPDDLPINGMLPEPVPYHYRLLDAEQRAGRGRAAVRLRLLGFSAQAAWPFALSVGLDWREHLPDRYAGRLIDGELEGEVLRHRLRDIVRSEDWHEAMTGAEGDAA